VGYAYTISDNAELKEKIMIIERTHMGFWRISDIIDGYHVERSYYGYTKREAVAKFKGEFK